MAKGKKFSRDKVSFENLTGSGKPKEQPEEQTFNLEDARKKKTPRREGVTAQGRVKYTTMLKPSLKEILQKVAKNNGMSSADVLETIILEYFGLPEDFE